MTTSDSAGPGNRASVSPPESAHSSGRTPGPGFPRRNRLDIFTPAERAIYDAMQAVEAAGCDPLLTEAVTLLGEAKNKVADFVDRNEARLRELLAEATRIIVSRWPEVRSDELRAFIRKHRDVPEFKDLVFTLILISQEEGLSG